MDENARLRLYELIIARYGGVIAEKEAKSITEIRQRCSPYNDFVKNISTTLKHESNLYDYERHFLSTVEKAISHVKSMETLELGIAFWLSFEEISSLKAASPFDKSLLLCALLRSLGSDNARVAVTEKKKNYVLFEFANEKYAVNVATGSMLAGEDVSKALQEDKMLYSFNDLMFESYEDD